MPFSLVVRLAGVGAVAVLLAACQSRQIDNTLLTPPVGVSFSGDVRPLFARRCQTCHIADAQSGVSLASHAAVLASVGAQYGTAVVVPGDAAASPLVDKVGPQPRFGARMPLGEAPLSADDVALLRAWVDDGAPDN